MLDKKAKKKKFWNYGNKNIGKKKEMVRRNVFGIITKLYNIIANFTYTFPFASINIEVQNVVQHNIQCTFI